jgi:formylglycine-generating enzyme required for sulfatase activity
VSAAIQEQATINFFPPHFPPKWASEWGEDEYGLWIAFTLNGIYQAFRWIPPGTFLMGSPENEKGRWDSEKQHQVTLTQGYWLADTACTQALWKVVMGDNPASFKDDENNPVEQVSWDDVQTFLQRLNELIPGLDAALPTEAQWEYACRAGMETAFSFVGELTLGKVNYRGTWGDYNKWGEGALQCTAPVRSYPPNSWGLYEMHGNVLEWCHDWYGEYPAESVADPVGAETDFARVLRGGSWLSDGRRVRSAYRSRDTPSLRFNYIGFRFAPGQASRTTGRERA